MPEIPSIDGDEVDGLGKFKKYYNWKPGQRKNLKRKYNKRVRQAWKKDIR